MGPIYSNLPVVPKIPCQENSTPHVPRAEMSNGPLRPDRIWIGLKKNLTIKKTTRKEQNTSILFGLYVSMCIFKKKKESSHVTAL